jgi:hypothetical protein
MTEDAKTGEAREAEWWAAWFAAGYNWAALASKEIEGRGLHGEANLQDYWRRDPVTGVVRDDASLKQAGELVKLDGRWWHLVHLPPRGRDGVKSWKAELDAPEWEQVGRLVTERLVGAVVTEGAFSFGNGPWRPGGPEGRAVLDGAVLGPRLNQPEAKSRPLNLCCRNTAFLGDLDLTSAEFGPGADFSGAIFFADANFHNSIFFDDVSFQGAIFCGAASFQDATVSGDANFYSATFFGDARFYSTTIAGVASFHSAAFFSVARFDSAVLSGRSSFHGVTFSGDARFYNVTFAGGGRFHRTTFSQLARFDNATFSGDGRFYSAMFLGDARFYSAIFCGVARFHGARFCGVASFDSATFEKGAAFSSPERGNGFEARARVSFRNAVLNGAVKFNTTVAEPERSFAGAFHAARFIDIADFSGAVGAGEAGRLAAAFGEAQFEKALILTDGADRKARRYFRDSVLAVALGENGAERDTRLAQLEAGCRTIKVAMGKARDELREQRYYRFQLRARLGRSDIDGWEKAFGLVYLLLSDFGSSLWRPLLALVLFTALCGQGYAVWGASLAGGQFEPVPSRDFAFEGQGGALAALKPFATIEAPKPRDEPAKDPAVKGKVSPSPARPTVVGVLTQNAAVTLGLRVATALQVVVSTLLIFLFGLAVKRRFQIS